MPERGAQFPARDLRTSGIEAPQQLAVARVDGVHDAVAGGDIEDAVDGQRRGLRVADVEIERPRELQPPDGVAIDFRERAVVSLAGGAADAGPVARVEFRGEWRHFGGDRQAPRNPVSAAKQLKSDVACFLAHSDRRADFSTFR